MASALRNQVALFVRSRDGRVRLATWTEWRARGSLRREVVVWRVVRTLLPRDRIGHGMERHGLDVAREDLEAWLEAHEYTIVSRLDGPPVDEPLGLW